MNSQNGSGFLPAKPSSRPCQKATLLLPEMPAEQHEIAAFGVAGREVDEPAVEILYLHAGRLELGNE